jgi:hypothetical protein
MFKRTEKQQMNLSHIHDRLTEFSTVHQRKKDKRKIRREKIAKKIKHVVIFFNAR